MVQWAGDAPWPSAGSRGASGLYWLPGEKTAWMWIPLTKGALTHICYIVQMEYGDLYTDVGQY